MNQLDDIGKKTEYSSPPAEKERWKLAENVALREFFFHHNACRTPDQCWPWPKYRDKHGYGCIIFDGFKFAVHRLSFTHYKGIIPHGFLVMHQCDNPPCFNPRHLFLGTQQDNVDDMMRKGRHPNSRLPREINVSWAWQHPAHNPPQFTDEQAEQRARFAAWLSKQNTEKGIA